MEILDADHSGVPNARNMKINMVVICKVVLVVVSRGCRKHGGFFKFHFCGCGNNNWWSQPRTKGTCRQHNDRLNDVLKIVGLDETHVEYLL